MPRKDDERVLKRILSGTVTHAQQNNLEQIPFHRQRFSHADVRTLREITHVRIDDAVGAYIRGEYVRARDCLHAAIKALAHMVYVIDCEEQGR